MLLVLCPSRAALRSSCRLQQSPLTAARRARAVPRPGRCALTLAAVQPTASGDSGIGPAMRAYRAEVAAFGKASEEVIDAMSAEVDQLLEASYARSLVFRRQLAATDPEAAAELDRDFPIVPRRAARSKAQPPKRSKAQPPKRSKAQPSALSLPPSPAAAWPPLPADAVPAGASARSAAAAAAAAAAVSFATAAAGHEAAAEAAQAAAASQPATAMAAAGEEWMRAAAAWRSAYEALAVAQQAQPGLAAVVEAEAALDAAERFKQQRQSLRS